ncbi:MAG: putative alpha/beta hydrolase, partial [Myxococcota bacterium]
MLVGHAMFCNARTLDRPEGQGLGTTLAHAGFETLLLDFRGHGASAPLLGPDVDASYDDYILRDIPAAVAAARAAFPNLPLALMGHSL